MRPLFHFFFNSIDSRRAWPHIQEFTSQTLLCLRFSQSAEEYLDQTHTHTMLVYPASSKSLVHLLKLFASLSLASTDLDECTDGFFVWWEARTLQSAAAPPSLREKKTPKVFARMALSQKAKPVLLLSPVQNGFQSAFQNIWLATDISQSMLLADSAFTVTWMCYGLALRVKRQNAHIMCFWLHVFFYVGIHTFKN